MCGITGILNLAPAAPPDEGVLRQMLAMLRHRGPDEFGLYLDAHAGLGSARLSIIDLSGGQQPIGNEDESQWIVFNGEIFNYIELRPELERRGHRFRTHSDTEVILHLYEEYGPDCLHRLNGQFAIAIWDNRKRELFLARDRVGIRPLFYAEREGRLLFGSEVKSMLAHPALEARLRPETLAQVFTYWSVQPPDTVFKGVFTLPPGAYLLAREGRIRIERYWEPDYTPETPRRRPQEYIEELESLLVDAAVIRLRADVPVGAYLSGGLDSSLTTAIIRKHTGNRLETFSIAFDDPEFDESAFQGRMAAQLGTEHHVTRAAHADIGRVFPEVIWHAETPILRTSPAPMYLLSALVQRHSLKVVLTGEGADEVFGGYNIFREALVRRFWARNPASELRPLLLRRLYPNIARLQDNSEAYLRAFFRKGLTETDSPWYSHRIRWGNAPRLLRFLARTPPRGAADPEKVVPLPKGFRQWPPLGQAQYLEVATFLSPYLLSSQGDRPGMAHSIEGRFPFLDYRIVEFGNRLPPDLKVYGLIEKWILKQVGRRYLPPEIWQRPKRPYRAPIQASFCGAATPEYLPSLLSEAALRETGLFKPRAVAHLWEKANRQTRLGEVEEMALVGIISAQLTYHHFVKDFSRRLSDLRPADRVKVVRVR
ncbi:MAG TPA: asparagine synthase (glutamine-hydrolyzing) [Chloroflexi bacterium]|nr:asparagine synthase (glutamine-hydrolyzing) [Chloroflexota bacterium]